MNSLSAPADRTNITVQHYSPLIQTSDVYTGYKQSLMVVGDMAGLHHQTAKGRGVVVTQLYHVITSVICDHQCHL